MARALEIDEHRLLVAGASRSAIYDFEDGLVYPLPDRVLYDALAGRRPESTSSDEPDAPPVPLRLSFAWLEVTGRCFLRCPHCHASAGEPSTAELPTEFWIDALDQLARLGLQRVQITGGEATTRADLGELVSHAASNGIRVELFTNLVDLPEDLVDLLLDTSASVRTTVFSADAAVHDATTGMPGSHRATTEHIQKLRALGVSVGVSRPLVPSCGETAAAKPQPDGNEQRPSDPNIIGPVWPLGRAVDLQLPTPDDWPVGTGSPSILHATRAFYERVRHHGRCFPGKVAVRADGTVFPCVFFRGLTLGNLQEDSLDAILRRESYQELSERSIDSIDGCRDCEFRYACYDAHCRAMPAAWGAAPDAKIPSCRYDPHSGTWQGEPFGDVDARAPGDSRQGPARPAVELHVEDWLVRLEPQQRRAVVLNPVAAEILHRLRADEPTSTITEALLSEYEAAPDEVRADVEHIARNLRSSGLVP